MNMTSEQLLEKMLQYIKEQANQGNVPYYNSIMNNPSQRGKIKQEVRAMVNTGEIKPVHTKPEDYTLKDIIEFVIKFEMARKIGNDDVFVFAAEEELNMIKAGPVFKQYWPMMSQPEISAQGRFTAPIKKVPPQKLNPSGFPTTPQGIMRAGMSLANAAKGNDGKRTIDVGDGERWPVEAWDEPIP